MKILVTGVAGFIGFHLTKELINKKYDIVGIDSLNSYYDLKLKQARLLHLENKHFKFIQTDLSDTEKTKSIFKNEKPSAVIHFAAQAGVRYSISDPHTYLPNNFTAFLNILECCRENDIMHLIYASSSSVYGQNSISPFSEEQNVECPENLYAASKKSNELMAYSYANLYKINCIGLRFFTVYGPWGRPDMAYFKFVKNILEDKPIDIYGFGNMYRDFTYIDDIIDGVVKILEQGPVMFLNKIDVKKEIKVPSQIFNIGNNKPILLNYFVEIIEKSLGKKAIKNYKEIQLGDMYETCANIEKIQSFVDFKPKTPVEIGIPKFVDWYKHFYYKN